MRRKRPCSICRRWFRPDARTTRHQRVCSRAECQKERRRRTQASWRERNPEYGASYRLDQRRRVGERAEPLRMPAPLDKVPWQVAKDVMGAEATELLGVSSRLILGAAKDVIRAHLAECKGVPLPLPSVGAKDVIVAGAP
jgi:hypothetical protein